MRVYTVHVKWLSTPVWPRWSLSMCFKSLAAPRKHKIGRQTKRQCWCGIPSAVNEEMKVTPPPPRRLRSCSSVTGFAFALIPVWSFQAINESGLNPEIEGQRRNFVTAAAVWVVFCLFVSTYCSLRMEERLWEVPGERRKKGRRASKDIHWINTSRLWSAQGRQSGTVR